ncbi:CH_domain superfamily [Hexamita inflata]|uniref:CH domain superfamily n=1 Tax=Hexamita inflata TaxID=28002 RepID=A0AA86TUW6_9EUKA|nr:CH domain superfamily [Hexamita inflata]
MWQLIYYPFPEPVFPSLVPGFSPQSPLDIVRPQQKQIPVNASAPQKVKYTENAVLWRWFCQVLEFQNAPTSLKIHHLVKSGYLFGKFLNKILGQTYKYQESDQSAVILLNWRKILEILKSEPRIKSELLINAHIFLTDEKPFFSLLSELSKIHLTHQLLQQLSQQPVKEIEENQLQTFEQFKSAPMKEIQKFTRVLETQTPLTAWLQHYGANYDLCGEEWRNGKGFQQLITKFVIPSFQLLYKDPVQLFQIIKNAELVIQVLKDNGLCELTDKASDLASGNEQLITRILTNFQKRNPFLLKVHSQYSGPDLARAISALETEIHRAQLYGTHMLLPALMGDFRSGQLLFKYIKLLILEQILVGDLFNCKLSDIQLILKKNKININLKDIETASEEMAVNIIEQLIMLRYRTKQDKFLLKLFEKNELENITNQNNLILSEQFENGNGNKTGVNVQVSGVVDFMVIQWDFL